MEWSHDSSIPALAQSLQAKKFVIFLPSANYPPSFTAHLLSSDLCEHSETTTTQYHSGRPSAMPTTTRECEAISKELQDRYELDDELDLKEIAPLMLQLREALPPASFKFLLTLCESVFSKLDPDLVQVPVMKKKLEAALAAQAKTLGRRGGEDAATDPPDRL